MRLFAGTIMGFLMIPFLVYGGMSSEDVLLEFAGFEGPPRKDECTVKIARDENKKETWIKYANSRAFEIFDVTESSVEPAQYRGRFEKSMPSSGWPFRVPASKSEGRIHVYETENGSAVAKVTIKNCIKRFLFWKCKKSKIQCLEN